MKLSDISDYLPKKIIDTLTFDGIVEFRSSQVKAIRAGLLSGANLLVCTPTASGKTLIAEMAFMKNILELHKKSLYIVPLVALAREKFRDFSRKYGSICKVALSVGDYDSSADSLSNSDLIICTAEKLDSVLRHNVSWVSNIGVSIIDEIHLLNDPSRGPTLELLITLLRTKVKNLQLIGLSATIGNPSELSSWLKATLVEDLWRPVLLRKGIYYDGKISFDD